MKKYSVKLFKVPDSWDNEINIHSFFSHNGGEFKVDCLTFTAADCYTFLVEGSDNSDWRKLEHKFEELKDHLNKIQVMKHMEPYFMSWEIIPHNL